MEPIALEKLTMKKLGAQFATIEDVEHLDNAAALVARFYVTRGFAEWRDIESWAMATNMSASLGGVNPARLRIALDELVAEVEGIVAAESHAKKYKKDRKPLVASIGSLGEDIVGLEATIAELEAAIAGKRSEQADAEAQVQKLDDCESLVELVKSEPSHSRRKAVWEKVKTGKHGYE